MPWISATRRVWVKPCSSRQRIQTSSGRRALRKCGEWVVTSNWVRLPWYCYGGEGGWRRESEPGLFGDFLDGFCIAHGVVVKAGHACGDEFDRLLGAPLDAYLPDGFVVGGFLDGRYQFLGEVDEELARDASELVSLGDGFQARHDGHFNTDTTAGVHVFEVLLVVEEHLGNDVMSAGLHLHFGVVEVGIEVGGFEVFFRIACDADAEIGLFSIDNIGVEVDAFVHVGNLAHEVEGIGMALFVWHKTLFKSAGIAAQGEDVVDAQEVEVNEGVFGFVFGEATADEVRDSVHFVAVHDGSADAYGARALSDGGFFVVAGGAHFVDVLFAVIGNINEGRLKLHEAIQGVEDGLHAAAFERW